MPIYPYQCSACNYGKDEYQKMHEPHIVVCPDCGRETYKRQVCQVHTDLKEFHRPVKMNSIAVCSLEEVRELQRTCPGIEISDNPDHPDFGVPIARSRAEKLRILSSVGWEEKN